MTKKELAALLGISGAMVSRLAKRGMPTDDVDRAKRWRRRHLEPGRTKGTRYDPAQATTGPGPGMPSDTEPPGDAVVSEAAVSSESFLEARTRREIADANLAEMREREARRELIRLDVVTDQLAITFATIRDALLQMPNRIAPSLAALSDSAKVHDLLYSEIHQALTTLANASDRLSE